MDTTVVGIYKSSSSAQSAMNELLKTGISQNDMQLSGSGQGKASSDGIVRSIKEETGMSEFFGKLHGREETKSHAEMYEHAAGEGNVVLTVHARSEEMAHRAAEMMERFDPVDVEEYGAGIGSGASGTSAGGTRVTGTTASAEGKDDVQKGRPLDMRRGVRMYQRSSAAPVQRTDDTRFRSHWQNVHGSSGGKYEDYDPAYRYGSELRGSERWRDKQWSDMESGVRSDWEAKNPKGMWEKFKETIRYGWENPTGRYEDEARALGDRMAPGMGAEPGLGAESATSGSGRGETSRPSTSVSPGTGTSATAPDTSKPAAMAGGMSTSGASFTSDEARRSTMSTSRDTGAGAQSGSSSMDSPMASSGRQDDIQKGRGQSGQAAASAGPSGESGIRAGVTSSASSISGGGAHSRTRESEDFRTHCEEHWKRSYWSSGGSFGDYQPAYEYGGDYADNDTVTTHTWEDVEPLMRADWQAYNREPGSWERNRDAVRCGWEKGKQGSSMTRSGHSLRK